VTDLPQRVEQNIQNRGLFKRGGKLLVAVSGGLDSMALLDALNKLSANHRWQLIVAHFNHRLRGRASDADERLVRKTAADMKLRVVAGSADVKAFAAKSKLSLEMAARKLRHEFLARAARKHKIKTIALAHHADDQVELFFLRLLRGAGGDGLAGMKWRSPSPADKTVLLVRPLLDFSKAELLAFARKNKIHFRDDATNFSPDFLRNRIRNELLPLLRKNYQPGLDKAILRLMEITGAESEFVGEVARLWARRRRGDESQMKSGKKKTERGMKPETPYVVSYSFDKLPIAIQRRVLQQQLADAGVAPDFDLIESLRQSADCFVSVSPNASVAREKSGEINLRTKSKLGFKVNELVLNLLKGMGAAVFDGVKFKWQIGSRGHSPHQMQDEFFDADKIGNKIVLRHWRAGDRFQPIGLKSAVKLQDLFVNAKISAARRRELVLAATADGEIFWVEGVRIGERFKLTPQTKRKLVWKWSNLAV
jgi:tRNA(Ile)-lysidine synthase